MNKILTLVVAILTFVLYREKAKNNDLTAPVILDLEDTEPVDLEEIDLELDPAQVEHEAQDEEMDGVEVEEADDLGMEGNALKGEGDSYPEDPLHREV